MNFCRCLPRCPSSTGSMAYGAWRSRQHRALCCSGVTTSHARSLQFGKTARRADRGIELRPRNDGFFVDAFTAANDILLDCPINVPRFPPLRPAPRFPHSPPQSCQLGRSLLDPRPRHRFRTFVERQRARAALRAVDHPASRSTPPPELAHYRCTAAGAADARPSLWAIARAPCGPRHWCNAPGDDSLGASSDGERHARAMTKHRTPRLEAVAI